MRIISILIVSSLLLTATYFKGWNSGFDCGYEAGLADVLIGIVNPEAYFLRKFKK